MAIYIPAATGYAWEKAKSKPVSSRGGRQSAEEGVGSFRDDLADGRGVALNVVAARELWVKGGSAKACVAACVSMALQRWIKAVVREWRRVAGAWRAFVWAKIA